MSRAVLCVSKKKEEEEEDRIKQSIENDRLTASLRVSL